MLELIGEDTKVHYRKEETPINSNCQNVYKGQEMSSRDLKPIKDVAIKKINKPQNGDNKYCKNEYRIIKLLKSDYVVSLIDYAIDAKNGDFYIITELCTDNLRNVIDREFSFKEFKKYQDEKGLKNLRTSNGSLQKAKIEWKKSEIDTIQKKAVDIISQILAGYLNLIQNRIVHRDLNPENILLHDETYKISGFASSRTLQDYKTQVQSSTIGTINYKSPQQYQSPKFTSKCDIYGIGVIFFELITGFGPPILKNDQQQENYPFIDFDSSHIDQNIKNFIISCLKFEEKDRIEWEQVYRDPIFSYTVLTDERKQFKKQIERLEFHTNHINEVVKIIKSILQSEWKVKKSKTGCKNEKKQKKLQNKKLSNQLLQEGKNLHETNNNLNYQKLIDSMKQQRTTAPRIGWPFFFCMILEMDVEIPLSMISKVFCLIDNQNRGYIREKQFKHWIESNIKYNFDDIINNKILACIQTLVRAMQIYRCKLEDCIEKKPLRFKQFLSLIKKIDDSITDKTINSTYLHLKCGNRKQQIEFETLEKILAEVDYVPVQNHN